MTTMTLYTGGGVSLLKAICVELGIPTSMVKQNMIDLILGKQNEVI